MFNSYSHYFRNLYCQNRTESKKTCRFSTFLAILINQQASVNGLFVNSQCTSMLTLGTSFSYTNLQAGAYQKYFPCNCHRTTSSTLYTGRVKLRLCVRSAHANNIYYYVPTRPSNHRCV